MVEESRKQPKGKVPISRHPLFPAIVALWFGALFGLCSLAVGTQALEAIVGATRIDSIIPAATPPLGVTARILLALVMAGIGGAIGARLARLVVSPKAAPRPRRRATGAPVPVPGALMRSDYADDAQPAGPAPQAEPVAGTGIPALKRRALALSEDPAALDIHEAAPLPGSDLISVPEAAPALNADVPDVMPDAGEEVAEAVVGDEETALDLEQEAPEPSPESPVAPHVTPVRSAAERITSAPLDTLAPVELVERLAIALERRRERVTAVALAPAVPSDPAPRPEARAADAQPLSALSLSAPSLSAPSLPAMPAALRPLVLEEPEADDDQADFAFDLPPRGFTLPARDEDAASSVSVSPAAAPAEDESVSDEGDDDEARVLEEGYSSLLGLSRPAQTRNGFVRIEEPEDAHDAVEPVVIFPGQGARADSATGPAEQPAESPAASSEAASPAQAARPFDNPNGAASAPAAPASATAQDPDEAERALRAALMTLQRMSGAA